MIRQTLFNKYFAKVETSFSRSISDKIKEGWYEEVMKCEPLPFSRAMRKLALGDKLPHFGHFWVQYNIAKQDIGGPEVERGCDDCRYGFIHYRKDGYDYTAFCKACYPERRRTLDPRAGYEYQLGMEPWRAKKSVLIPPTIAKAMIEELREKMSKRGMDWEAETEEAWKLHEKAVTNEQKS